MKKVCLREIGPDLEKLGTVASRYGSQRHTKTCLLLSWMLAPGTWQLAPGTRRAKGKVRKGMDTLRQPSGTARQLNGSLPNEVQAGRLHFDNQTAYLGTQYLSHSRLDPNLIPSQIAHGPGMCHRTVRPRRRHNPSPPHREHPTELQPSAAPLGAAH